MNHAELQANVFLTARRLGLHVHHCGMLGSQRGFPDLVVIGRGGILFRELKVPPDATSHDQRLLGYTIQASGGDWAVWRPEDWASGLIDKEMTSCA